ncbi:hypothetical protein M413DRAFT_450034 [Hebeloma cylindrosporum]|uniref:F-box domain-containing protein n=1 Tax=Hebeloma cylindrosporum TaxID=76867 RepID=A0A0C3BRZ0_HEBCY|nr:hypothetical protein M413DRAFT_450034 [Hebeloma cylindrosporum h7]
MTVIFLGSINATQMFSTPPISLKQVSFILRSCPELMSFRLEVILFDDGFEQNPQHISLPCLQSFSLYDSGIDVSFLFSILELPSLKYLEFNSNAQHLERSALEMLLPRITTLERLTTEPQFFSQGYYLKCLNHMTSLTHISIKRPPHVRAPIGEDLNGYYKIVSDSLLEWFTTPYPAGDYPVPNLETFECYAASEFTDNAVVDFIRKKHALPGIRALKKISISFSRAPTVDIVQAIGKDISSQLDPYLTYPFAMESSYDRVGFHPFAGICPSSTAR